MADDSTITLPASMQPPVPPPNALDTTPGANPTEPVVHYQLSSGDLASLPQSSVPALLQQDKDAKQIPSPASGEVLVQLSSGETATLPATSLAALKQQDPNYQYIAGNVSPEQKKLVPDFDLLTAVAGPTTALGAPLPPGVQQEAGGVSDILHGDVRQGVSKIWNAERPHVIQGSLLEEAMQKIDPNFQGSVTKDEATAQRAAANAGAAQDSIDVAQFINKDTHPVAKALAENAQGLTSPENLAIMYSTGGLGLVDNPAVMKFAGRLISGGFSAMAIGDAYAHYKGFRAAVDAGDWNEAEYQITHAITSGVLGVIAGKYAAEPVLSKISTDVSLLKNPFRPTEVTGATSKMEPVVAGRAAKAGLSEGTAEVTSEAARAQTAAAKAEAETTTQTNVDQAIQNIATRHATENGLPTPATGAPTRDILTNSGNALVDAGKADYATLDKFTDGKFTNAQNELKNAQLEMQRKAGTTEVDPVELEANVTRAQKNVDNLFDEAVKNGMPKDTAEAARTKFRTGQATLDAANDVRMANRVRGAGVRSTDLNVLENRWTARFDSGRLQEAFGEEGAKDALAQIRSARETGELFSEMPATETQALKKLIAANTTTEKFGTTTEWGQVGQDFSKLSNRNAIFSDVPKVEKFINDQAFKQKLARRAVKTAIRLAGVIALGAAGKAGWELLH